AGSDSKASCARSCRRATGAATTRCTRSRRTTGTTTGPRQARAPTRPTDEGDHREPPMDANTFTLKTQAALEAARHQAAARDQQAIEPEHVLLGLLAAPEGVVFPLLHK